jgi:hypothetical protein
MKPIAKGYLLNKRLSASQIQSALNGYNDYYKKYILGVSFGNKYTDFGNKVHKLVQNTDIGIDIPKGTNEKNFEILSSEFQDVILNGYLDVDCEDVIIEIKSSKDISDTNKYELQCDFYQYTNKKSVRLYIFETQEIDGVLSLTGNFKCVDHKYDEERIKKNIADAISKIVEYGRKYQDAKLDTELKKNATEYRSLKEQIEILEARQDELKEKAKELSPDGYKSETATIFYTERKSYEYPKDIKELEATVKEKKKEYESSASYKITKSITIK